MNTISAKYIKECLDYNPETGIFVWKDRPLSHFKSEAGWKIFHSSFSGLKAGSVNVMSCGKSYIRIRILGKYWLAHRLAWIIVNGSIDENLEIDHIDGNGTNNSIRNLRLVNRTLNAQNHKMQKSNKSGVVGVYFDSNCGKWRAQITSNKVKYDLGCYSEFNEAVMARKSAELLHGFHKNHGSHRSLY